MVSENFTGMNHFRDINTIERVLFDAWGRYYLLSDWNCIECHFDGWNQFEYEVDNWKVFEETDWCKGNGVLWTEFEKAILSWIVFEEQVSDWSYFGCRKDED